MGRQRSRFAQAHLLIGRRKVELRIQAHGGFRHAWSHAMQRSGLEDWGVHDPLRHEPLYLVQQLLAFTALPEAPVATISRPLSFFSRQAVMKVARSVVRICVRMPIAAR